MRTWRAAVSMAVMTVALLGVAAAPASAASTPSGSAASQPAMSVVTASGVSPDDVTQYATPGAPNSSDVGSSATCNSATATACFQRYGDLIWIYNPDLGWVDAHYTNWLREGTGWESQPYRIGDCVTNYVGWSYCNKNFYEGSGIRLYTCYGSPGTENCDLNYQWVVNNK
jgi:hypothetical protein